MIYKNGVGNKVNDSPETDMNLNQLILLDFHHFFNYFFFLLCCCHSQQLYCCHTMIVFLFLYFHSCKRSIGCNWSIAGKTLQFRSVDCLQYSTSSIWWCIWFHVHLVSFGPYHFILSELGCWLDNSFPLSFESFFWFFVWIWQSQWKGSLIHLVQSLLWLSSFDVSKSWQMKLVYSLCV